MAEVQEWYWSLPGMTRWWLSLTVAVSLCARFGLFTPHTLMLWWEPFWYGAQVWRPFTALFYYPISQATGFHFLINCYFLYNYSLRLETGLFDGRPADYLFMLLFNWFLAVVVGFIGGIPVLMDPMVLSVLYVWCQLNKDMIVSFWFGTRFKAMYFPWVLFGFNFIISGGGIMEIIGIVIGHIYFFLMFKYPIDYGGPALLRTPSILKSWLPDRIGGVGGFGVPPQARAAPGAPPRRGFFAGGHDWGRGQALGGN